MGDFVVANTPLAQVASIGKRPEGGWAAALARCMKVQGRRDVDQDPGYGLQQPVEVGLRALSPGIHDPATAQTCIDHLGALLHRLSSRRLDGGHGECAGRLRLIVVVNSYESLVELALASLTHYAGSHTSVPDRLITAVETAGAATQDPDRLAVLGRRLQAHLARTARADLAVDSFESLQRRAIALRDLLQRREQSLQHAAAVSSQAAGLTLAPADLITACASKPGSPP